MNEGFYDLYVWAMFMFLLMPLRYIIINTGAFWQIKIWKGQSYDFTQIIYSPT